MSPSELRRMAERCRDNSVAKNAAIWRGCSPHEWEWSQEQQEEMARYCLDASHCVDHVLSTVREDDGEALGFNYVATHPSITQSCMKYSCGTITIRGLELELHSCDLGGEPCYLIGRDGLRLETRGQLRRLLEGLGVEQ